MSSLIVPLFSTFIGWWLYKVIYASGIAYFEIKKAKQEEYVKNTYVNYGPRCMKCGGSYGSRVHDLYCGGKR